MSFGLIDKRKQVPVGVARERIAPNDFGLIPINVEQAQKVTEAIYAPKVNEYENEKTVGERIKDYLFFSPLGWVIHKVAPDSSADKNFNGAINTIKQTVPDHVPSLDFGLGNAIDTVKLALYAGLGIAGAIVVVNVRKSLKD